MRVPSRSAVDVFLATVLRELRGLDAGEQQEILQELADHLRDSAARRRAEAADLGEEAVLDRVVAEMGDPGQVGRRIRHEHLAQRLPLAEAILTAAPTAAPALTLVAALSAGALLPAAFSPTSPAWLPWAMLALGPALVLLYCLWGLSRGHRLWLATTAGYLLASLAIVGPVPFIPSRLANDTIQLTLAVALLAVAFSGLVPRQGNLLSNLAVLGGLAFLVQFRWGLQDGVSKDLITVVAMPVPCLGIVALGISPRRRRRLVSWAALLIDWGCVLLGMVYAWTILSARGVISASLWSYLSGYFPTTAALATGVALVLAQLLATRATHTAIARITGPSTSR